MTLMQTIKYGSTNEGLNTSANWPQDPAEQQEMQGSKLTVGYPPVQPQHWEEGTS